MKQRGRKSAAKLSVVAPVIDGRPGAPDELLPHEKALWDSLTASRNPDFFDVASWPLLTEYCRLKTELDLMARNINDFDESWLLTDEGVKRFRYLTTIRDQAQSRIIMLSRSMRLTNQSRYEPKNVTTRPKRAAGKVWQREG